MKRCPTPSKVKYASYAVAQSAANGMLRSLRKKGLPGTARIYLCDCGWIHVTKMTKHEHKYKHDSGYRSKKDRETRIKAEADYWRDRLGVDDD